ncbi:unnamed protein product [Rotaria sp. Silwood1]|nr:unnamed protein product [Rotaria sp. Silwood1]
MSSTVSKASVLSKAEIQDLVKLNSSSISFAKPDNVRSEFWASYSQIYVNNVAQNFILCSQCRTVLKWISDNGTRVMSHHNCEKAKRVPNSSHRQRTISSFCQKASVSPECRLVRKRITEACVEYCAVDGRPFESVAGSGFLSLAKQLICAGATLGTSISASELLPHPSTVSIELLFQLKMFHRNVERTYLILKNQLISICEGIKHYCITANFWSEKSTGIHYGGLSMHYIDSNSCLRVFTLACQAYDYETQHAINIRSFINKILEEFSLYLNNNVFIVTDNENKMKSAFKDNVKRIGCSAHYINKVLEHAFTYNDIQCDAAQLLFTLVRGIVTRVRKSHKQSLLSTYVQNYCDTRFNGVYLLFESFLKVYHELPSVLNDEQKINYLKIDRDDLEVLCSYLKNFCEVIEKLSSENTPTLHLVIPYKQFLINLSSSTDDNNQLILSLKKYIGKQLEDYWIINDVHYIATMLHPNLKSFNHAPQKKYHAETLLKLEFEKYRQPDQQQSSSNNNTKIKPSEKKNKSKLTTPLDDIFDPCTSSDELPHHPEIKTEFDRYIEDHKKIDINMNVLSYWNENKLIYPTLATIAQRVLCIPATNTSVERLFSDSGNTITSRRTRLETSKVNQLLFIRRNLSLLRELFPPSIEQSRKRSSSCSAITSIKKLKHSEENDDDIAVLQVNLDDPSFDVDDDDDGGKENRGSHNL